MNPAVLALVPVFKDSIVSVADKLAGGVSEGIKSYGRGAENIMGAVADRIRGPQDGPRA